MTASKVRTDYEQLRQIAQVFGQQAECARQLLSALQKDMGTLQGGDWVGKSADKLYAEMNSAVLPAMQRVVAAMNEAASTTARISRVMKQAEDDSAALFRLDGKASSIPLGGSAVPGPAFGAVSSFIGAKADSKGGGSSSKRSPGNASNDLSPQMKKMLANLDPQVAEWVKASTDLELKAELEKLAKAGLVFEKPYSGDNAKKQFENVINRVMWMKVDDVIDPYAKNIKAKYKAWPDIDEHVKLASKVLKLKGTPAYEKRRAEFLKADEKIRKYWTKEMAAAKAREQTFQAEYQTLKNAYASKSATELTLKERVAMEILTQKTREEKLYMVNLEPVQQAIQEAYVLRELRKP
jgi:WXG100 family type VII secretion target